MSAPCSYTCLSLAKKQNMILFNSLCNRKGEKVNLTPLLKAMSPPGAPLYIPALCDSLIHLFITAYPLYYIKLHYVT